MAEFQIHATRVCSKCGLEKPLTSDNFNVRNARFIRTCKECRSAYMATYYAARRENWNDKAKAWRRDNPEAASAYERARGRKEKMSAYKKRRWANMTAEERDKQKKRVADWKAANPDKARAIEERRLERIRTTEELRAKAARRMREWVKANPESAAATRDRRRAREVEAEGSYTREDVRAILKKQGRSCFYCSGPLTKFECDHFIPLSRGGTNWPDNLRLSCPPCNYSKGAKLPWEWKPDRFPPPE